MCCYNRMCLFICLVAPTLDLSAFKDGLEVIAPFPLKIRVPISGYPKPKATWTFGEKQLTPEERVSMVTKSTFTELVVSPSIRPDKGTYSLTLENDITSVSGEIEVNVIGKIHTLRVIHLDSLRSSKTYLGKKITEPV